MKKNLSTPLIYLVLLVVIIALVSGFDPRGNTAEEVSYNDFIQLVRDEKVSYVDITDLQLVGLYVDSELSEETFPAKYDFYTYIPSLEAYREDMTILTEELKGIPRDQVTNADFPVESMANPTPKPSIWEGLLPYVLMIGALAVLYYFMFRSQGGGNSVMNFGKSRARTQMDPGKKVTFADVAGADEEKEELREVVEFMRSPKRFTEMGARIPKGVLLVGPPGTGKTLLAKAVAGEAGAPFFSISGSDFVEMFVGVGASRVRDLFSTAKKCAPAVVFIDEIDAVGRQRGAGLGGGHDEREQTLNQLLVEMDGFAINEGIIVLAATNRPDILDPALLRPGRFDRQITVNYPDVKGREEILKVHAKGKPLAEDVSLAVLAKRTSGFTGADLENVLNEAAILAARYKKKKITMLELEEAITRTVVGPEKKSRVVTDEDKKVTAYHEAGHAIVALKMPHCDPVHEVSIIPRGAAAGYTMTMPDTDDNHVSRGKILDEICMCMGGRVAESIALDDVCTGAIGDLKRASELARRMVIEFGMSDAIGPVFLGGDTEVFIAKDWGHQRNYSEEVAAKVDAEMRRILEEQFDRAKAVLEENREAMDRVVKALLEYERIDGDQFIKIFNGEPIEIRSYKDRKADLEKPDEEVLAQEQAQAAAKEAQVPPTAPEQPAQPEQPEQPDEK
ncbi:MAG TPA: ATP-dependent zinc metalloprotease FtsH [Candidatus Pelethousia gallinarum]|nr:ATP-dependent zinc metalloprotease FtsH [Candidatus Pelethousia gallinarum]